MEEVKLFQFLKRHPIAGLVISGLVFLSGGLFYALSEKNRYSANKDISHIEKLLTNHITGIEKDMDELKAGQKALEDKFDRKFDKLYEVLLSDKKNQKKGDRT